jgi:hypothetical protein
MFHFSFRKLKGAPAGVMWEIFKGLKVDGAFVPCMESLRQNHIIAVVTPNLQLLIVVGGLRLSLQHSVISPLGMPCVFPCRSSRPYSLVEINVSEKPIRKTI